MKTIILIFFTAVFLACSNPQKKFDHSSFDSVLRENVNNEGMVNYEMIKKDSRFDSYLDLIADAEISNFSRNEKLAFYINSYNALVIKNVLNHYPIDSPMKVDGFFNTIKFRIAGESLTLDEIEHKKAMVIEPVLIHFGLVCGAVSCPKLIARAYQPESVFDQLKKNAEDFLNDSTKNRIDRTTGTLYLSSIFKWFSTYFSKRYGSLENAAAEFMNKTDREYLRNNKPAIKFMPYNWQLNTQ